MKIEIIVEGEFATAKGPFPFTFLKTISTLSGRKMWNGSKSVRFDANSANLARLRSSDHEFRFIDKTGSMKETEELENLPTQHDTVAMNIKYVPAVPWLEHQRRTLSISWNRIAYAHFHEMGLGKSAIAIAEAAIANFKGKVTGVLILSPKGVHKQWIEDQIPEHISPQIVWSGIVWKKKAPDRKEMNRKGLVFFSMNIDAIRTPSGMEAAEAFLAVHRGRSMMIVDESHAIKSPTADRTKAAWKLGESATYRRIMTGTPISKNIIDAWSQFKFLDVRILGHKYMTSFRSQYCVMGGFEGRQIVGQKNTEEFHRLIAPHSYRVTKREVLDLPPKMYPPIREYEMGPETARHYSSLKETFMTALDNGEIMDVQNAAALVMRLQQVVCGYLPFDEGQSVQIISDERIKVMMEIATQIEGKTIIWHRFIEDGKRIVAALAKEFGTGRVVEYRGANKDEAKRAFIEGKATHFVSSPAAGGTGVDGLQKVCQNAIYYSNSFRALDRWQSEDRIDRMGMKGSAFYFDIVAMKSVDRSILRNLRGKKSLSDLTLDDIRKMVAEA